MEKFNSRRALVAWEDRGRIVRTEKIEENEGVERPLILGDALRAEIKQIVIEAMREAVSKMPEAIVEMVLLTPEQLAGRLQVPVSWVYEQSRHNKIPTHRVGRYIRFDIREVLQSARIEGSIRKAG